MITPGRILASGVIRSRGLGLSASAVCCLLGGWFLGRYSDPFLQLVVPSYLAVHNPYWSFLSSHRWRGMNFPTAELRSSPDAWMYRAASMAIILANAAMYVANPRHSTIGLTFAPIVIALAAFVVFYDGRTRCRSDDGRT